MSVVEGVVGSVNAILKTLECAICLELLKTPVTTGCGHFFCKFCITEVLKSNYRSPCPLCKRPFTRRSIQEAQQRQSVIQAAKELADVCGIFTGVKSAFSKENREAEVTKNRRSSLPGCRKSTSVQESIKSSSSKKRKSHESETSDANLNEELFADKPKDKSKKSVDSAVEDSVCVSTNDEIIPSTNKRHCQSRPDSDDDLLNLPSVDEILQTNNTANEKRKSDDMESSKKKSKEFPVVLIQRATESEIHSECSPEKDISVIPDTNVPMITTENNTSSGSGKGRVDADVTLANENKSGKILKDEGKIPLNNRGSRLKSRLSNKNEKNALANKTNQLNLKKQEAIDKSLGDKTKNAEKVDEYEFNAEDLVKENKEMDVELFISPAKSVIKKNNAELSLSPGTSRGRKMSRKRLSKSSNKNQNSKTSNSSVEEEILISNLNEAENFSLNIVNEPSKSSTTAVKNYSNEKECYNLKEINLPPVNMTSVHMASELVSVPQKELVHLDEITDTAVSVQTVASPEASKMDLLMKSPGWSKVKQVGKDFRVRKFSRLHVEKNTSNSCPSEVVAMDLDSAPNEPLSEPVYEKKLVEASHPTTGDVEMNDSSNKERKKFLESTFNVENKKVKNAVDSTVEIKTSSNVSESNMDDEFCINDEISDIPTLINETEREVGQNNTNDDDPETRFPCSLQDEISSCKDKEASKFTIASIKEMPLPNLKSAEEIDCAENEIASSVISNCYNENLTHFPISAKVKNISLASTPLTPHTHVDVNECIEDYNFVDASKNAQPKVINLGANFETESMEVDGIENVGINSNINSHLQHIGIDNSENNSLQHNYLTKNSFGKQNNGNVIVTPKLVKGKESLFKFDVLKTAENQDKNVYYAEHAQQTSQRLIDFCGNNRQPKSLFAPVSLCPTIIEPNALLKQNDLYEKHDSLFNHVERFNANMFKPSSTERTKVMKRTCLTLDEIQEAFANSSASGNPENICSLPFLSGDFRLNVCVSEETLNISVLKVVASDSFSGLQNRSKTLLLSEKNIQTSNSNSPVPSPTAILPSSNVESESSQPENQQKGGINVKTTNPFPFLSEYFSDSESTERVSAVEKEAPLNDSEIFPFVEPVNSTSETRKKEKQNEEMVCENVAGESVLPLVAVYNSDDVLRDLPPTQPHQGNDVSNGNLQDENEELFCVVSKEKVTLNEVRKMPFADTKVEKSPKSTDLSKKDEQSKEFVKDGNVGNTANSCLGPSAFESNSFSEKTSLLKNTATASNSLTKKKVSKSPVITKNYSNSKNNVNEKSLLITSEKSCKSTASPPEGNIFSENTSQFNNASNSKSYQQLFDDSEDFSSDPDMAFAMELVAPLKNIAQQMKSSANKEKSFQHGLTEDGSSSTKFPYSSKEKNPIATFEELILSKNKDSHQNSTVSQKPSRLSLKSNRNSTKKFKRIKTYESDEDSDVSESSKNESILSNISMSKKVKEQFKNNSPEILKTENLKSLSPTQGSKASPNAQSFKNHDLPCESLLDNSTLNSCVSEDITNNSSDIAMEIEDLDKKILSVVEKLKQCGHDDLLNQEKQKQPSERDITKLLDKNRDCSFDSEDSTDIFSQSVPPTPPDATANNNDSAYKASMYSHK